MDSCLGVAEGGLTGQQGQQVGSAFLSPKSASPTTAWRRSHKHQRVGLSCLIVKLASCFRVKLSLAFLATV